MPVTNRREHNKEQKRERILAAASTLFMSRGVDEVTTQEIADVAGIGAGTLFLYAKNKGELLLMVQNAHYATALATGADAACCQTAPVDAVMAIVAPIVACNKSHVGNGRTYLKEMLFGDPTEPHHAQALKIVSQTEEQLAKNIVRTLNCTSATATSTARTIMALLLRYLAAPDELSGGSRGILENIQQDVIPLLTKGGSAVQKTQHSQAGDVAH